MKRLFALAILAPLVTTAYAESTAQQRIGDVQVRMHGQLVGQTCLIGGDHFSPGKEITIELPTVNVDLLAKAGSTTGTSQTNLSLSGCPAGATLRWNKGGSVVDGTTGALVNNITNGSNAQVQILDNRQKPINLDSDPGYTLTGGEEQVSYYFNYLAKTAPVVAGEMEVSAILSVYY